MSERETRVGHPQDERRRRGELAISADYDPRSKRLTIELASGVAISVPVSKVQGLAGIAGAKIMPVQIESAGYGLHWPELDLDVSVPDLIAGCFGTRAWMSALARYGGRVSSVAKRPQRAKTERRAAARAHDSEPTAIRGDDSGPSGRIDATGSKLPEWLSSLDRIVSAPCPD